MSIPAAWHPDPTGRHEYRYWDGQRWTEHVANAGQRTADPIDGRPATQDSQTTQTIQAETAATVQQPASNPTTDQTTDHATPTPSSPATPTSDAGSGTAALEPQETAAQPATQLDPNAGNDAPQTGDAQPADEAPSAGGAQVTPLAHQPDVTGTAESDDGPPMVAAQDRKSHLRAAPDLTSTDEAQDNEASTVETSPELAPSPAHPDETEIGATAPSDDGDPTAPAFQAAEPDWTDQIPHKTTETSSTTGAVPATPQPDGRKHRERLDALGTGPAVAALIVGTVSVLLALMPFVGLIALPLGIVAVILGFVGRRRGLRSGLGKGTATTGITTGAAGIVLSIAVTVLFVWVVRESAFGVAEVAACIDQGIDARTCSQRFEQAFLDQLFRR